MKMKEDPRYLMAMDKLRMETMPHVDQTKKRLVNLIKETKEADKKRQEEIVEELEWIEI
jgi:1,2-phenylacetyl-CoA epoxidase catalytic subunit